MALADGLGELLGVGDGAGEGLLDTGRDPVGDVTGTARVGLGFAEAFGVGAGDGFGDGFAVGVREGAGVGDGGRLVVGDGAGAVGDADGGRVGVGDGVGVAAAAAVAGAADSTVSSATAIRRILGSTSAGTVSRQTGLPRAFGVPRL